MPSPATRRFLTQEALALATRLDQVRPLALIMPMVTAARVTPAAIAGIDDYLVEGRRELRSLIQDYLNWLKSPAALRATAEDAQRRFTIVRLRFQKILTQFDIFADVMTQRSEHSYGVWLAGLDQLAEDTLNLPHPAFKAPPLITYLDRGVGAAIRRARTRLPGGGANPVAIIRVPRERMVGSGIGSSLVHEVGHQVAALLDLVRSLRFALAERRASYPENATAWRYWERCISEIVADFWSVGRIGIGATVGLIGVVSLPKPFVFRLRLDDPHPFPWIRVKLSAAIGEALFPDPQWQRLARQWEQLYPKTGLPEEKAAIVSSLEDHIPAFVDVLLEHRPERLRGRSLREALALDDRRPDRLRDLFGDWQSSPKTIRTQPPSLVCAALGQARADGRLSAGIESKLVRQVLEYWALVRPVGGTAVPAPSAPKVSSPLTTVVRAA